MINNFQKPLVPLTEPRYMLLFITLLLLEKEFISIIQSLHQHSFTKNNETYL
jgi:hypothetical protein